jgi:hypothetical protein
MRTRAKESDDYRPCAASDTETGSAAIARWRRTARDKTRGRCAASRSTTPF